jgi:hypothetical protein
MSSSFPSRRKLLTRVLVFASMAAALALRGLIGQPAPNNDFHFSILGDRTGGATPQVYGRVWREVSLLHPDFVINVGDTIQGGVDTQAEREWLDVARVWNRYRGFKQYFTPGNHDIWSDASEKIYIAQTGFQPAYSFDYQDAHFTILDNSRERELDARQIAFLEKDLEANRHKHPKFVFFHRPFWIARFKQGDTSFPLHQLAVKHGVTYVISGHGHEFVHMKRDGIGYMEVGSSGGTIQGHLRRGEGFRQGNFYHHIWARVKGGQVWLTVKEIDGMMGQGRMFRAEDWDENGPKFETGDPAIHDNPET